MRAMYPSSVVHTGVKSFGCENSTAHESPIHSWKLIGPSVVCASKSGAVSLIVKLILCPLSYEVRALGLPGAQRSLPSEWIQSREERRSYRRIRPVPRSL